MRKLLFLRLSLYFFFAAGVASLFTSCDTPKKERLVKPFVIVGIEYNCCTGESSRYIYQDVNGNWESFTDKKDKFTVGDTLR